MKFSQLFNFLVPDRAGDQTNLGIDLTHKCLQTFKSPSLMCVIGNIFSNFFQPLRTLFSRGGRNYSTLGADHARQLLVDPGGVYLFTD